MTEDHFLLKPGRWYQNRGRKILLVSIDKIPMANCAACKGKGSGHRKTCKCLADGRVCHSSYAATTDPERLEKWLSRRKRRAQGIAQATGQPSGVFVLELDSGGRESLDKLIAENGGVWPQTEEHLSQSGETHFTFEMPADMDVRNHIGKLGKGIDIKGTGGYAVLPPSEGRKGTYRDWNGCDPVQAPGWLLDQIAAFQEKPERSAVKTYDPDNIPPEISKKARKFIKQQLDWIIEAPDGHQNQRIFTAARKLFSLANAGVLADIDADAMLLEAAASGNHPDYRAIATINSASRKAHEDPDSVFDLLGPDNRERAILYARSFTL